MLQTNSVNPALRIAIRAALTGGSLMASFGVANAQSAGPQPASAGTSAPALEEVVVTGSRIAVPNEVSITPVTFVSAVDIQRTGVTRVEDLLNQLPQVFADQNSNVSNASDGTATVNLRGLNAKRTLVLVNGQRLGPGDPLSGGQSDINMIPVEMIDSIEVLTGGASSTYGADAVAGVVNFKLNDHFEGVKIVADAGIYQNHNTNTEGVETAVQEAGYAEAPNNVWAGAQRSLAFIAGLNSPDGQGNATFYATYRNVLPIVQSKYAVSACTLDSGYLGTSGGPSGSGGINGKYACGGSATAAPANFLNATTGQWGSVGPGGTLAVGSSPTNIYNYGALNYFQRNDERYSAGTFLHYEFNEHATVYANTMFMDDRSVAQIAPSGDFANTGSFDCANPLMSAAEATFLGCTGTTGTTNPNILILRRDVEGGNRQQAFEHMDFREVLGLKGKLDDVWSYDASFNYSLVNLNSDSLNYFSATKLNNALNVTGTAADPVCTVGPPCVPYNLFGTGPVTAAQLAYLNTPGIETGRISQYDVNINFTGDLGKYGVQLPTASSGLQVNIGAEYRDARSSVLPDEENQTGDLAGSGGPTPPISGGIISREGFAEARMSLIDDHFMAKSLNLETGYRYSDYDLGFSTNTYKIGLDWAPVQDVRLRGSFARASRAPNVVELFNPASVGLDSYTSDPCSGATPTYTAAQCAKTGVTAAEYGHIASNPAGQYNGLLGGNDELKPETALTTSVGIGFTPSFLPNFRAQFDYYNINIQNVIQQIGGANILSQCALNGVLCSLIDRAPGTGSLWATNNGYIADTLVNVGDLLERGLDADIAYSYDFGAFGKLHTNLVGTYIDKYQVTPIALSPGTSYNCVGYYGPNCSSPTAGAGTPVFHWRHRYTTTWETPWSGLDMTLAWRFYSSVKLETLSPNSNLAAAAGYTVANGGISNTDARLSSYSYFDLTASMKVSDKLQVRLGVNNVLDKAPPVVGTTNIAAPPTGNGNTFPGVYDSLGRYLFAEVTAQF